MGLLSKIFSNARKPEGFFGRMMVNGMNGGSDIAVHLDDQHHWLAVIATK